MNNTPEPNFAKGFLPGSEVRFARVIVPKSGISVNLGGTAEKFRPKAVFCFRAFLCAWLLF